MRHKIPSIWYWYPCL